MELCEEPPEKKRSKSDDYCVICQERLIAKTGENPFVKNPTADGIKSLLNAAEIRRDDVFDRVFPNKDDILHGKLKIRYHKNCRASYTTKRNLHFVKNEPSSESSDIPNVSNVHRLQRKETSKFNIRTDCFICGKSYRRKRPLTAIATGTGATTRMRVIEAAIARKDEEIHLRMLCHPDLFAFDAKYHRDCYAHYISSNNIEAERKKVETDDTTDNQENAFVFLCGELKTTVLSGTKTVVTLSAVHKRMCELLQDANNCREYSVRKLKVNLKRHFGEKVTFITQPGKSDFLCSSEVTLGEALQKATELHLHVNDEGDFELKTNYDDQEDSSVALYKAAGIIRKLTSDITFQSEHYAPSGDLDRNKCKSFVPSRLYDFVSWCTSKSDFDSASCSDNRVNMKVLGICHNLIALRCKIQTPISFGLGIQMYHDFGSKDLIDILSALGHCISYDAVRKFTTSVALDQLEMGRGTGENSDAVYIPRGIFASPQSIVDAAIDNFDTNEDTINGKGTTHAMAMVLYQRHTSSETHCDMLPIPKSQQKALDVAHCEEEDMKRYNKPHKKPEPSKKFPSENVMTGYLRQVVTRDLFWVIARAAANEKSYIPAWSGFNCLVSTTKVPVAVIRYLPFINANPSDYSTIYTTLLKLVSIAKALGQGRILVTADLAIYSKAQQILWTRPDAIADMITMRLGGMHLTMAFLASIGKLFGDGGLYNLLTESNVYATSTVTQMFLGKQYSRGMRGIRLVHEGMYQQFLRSAEQFANEHRLPWFSEDILRFVNELEDSFRLKDRDACTAICQEAESKISSNVIETIEAFRKAGREQSTTFFYWDTFLEMGDILLRLTRADREANLSMHLDAVKKAIPFFFLAGRVNYARYTPVYVAEMKELETKDPIMFNHMKSGGFVVKRAEDKMFNCVPTDQALEQTINREAKTQGGIIGFTRRKGALLRWLLTRHVTGEYSEAFKDICINHGSSLFHDELGNARMQQDRRDATNIKEFIQSQCQNPFDLENIPSTLMNITTGQVATPEVEKSLIGATEKGQKATDEFFAERIDEGSSGSFWDPLPRCPVVTFSSMKKALSYDKDRKLIIDTEILFRRLLSVSKNREVDMRSVLSFELAAVPPSLFHDDGSMRKTTKAELTKKLEESCTNVITELPEILPSCSSVYIIDGMAMIQSLNESHFKTFNDLAEIVQKRIVRILRNPSMAINQVSVIFDRYDHPNSIKTNERTRRGAANACTVATHEIQGSRQVPNYRQYLKNSGNKASLANFISQYLCENVKDKLPTGSSVVLAGGFTEGEVVKQVTEAEVLAFDELFSSQEEADTRILLHAVHLSNHSRIIIRCEDTDVLILLVYYSSKGLLSPEIYMHAGHSQKFVTSERFIPVHEISNVLGQVICGCLPAVHALTGCDTTCAMFRIGKRKAYKTLSKNFGNIRNLQQFHENDTEACIESARQFVLLMHGKQARKLGQSDTLDDLRFLWATTTDKPASMLPPTEDAFKQHVLRAKYQTAIWCNSHIAKPELLDPVGHGWERNIDNELQPTMYTKDSAPVEMRDITHLYCTDKDCTNPRKCPCALASLGCLDICSCKGDCQNPKNKLPEEEEYEINGDE